MRLRTLKNLVAYPMSWTQGNVGFLTIRFINLFHYGRDHLVAPTYRKPNRAIKAQFAFALHFLTTYHKLQK